MKGIPVLLVGFFTVCLLFLGVSSFAQDGMPLPGDIQQDPNQLNLGEDKTLIYEPASRAGKDTLAIAPVSRPAVNSAKPKNGTQKTTREEEDALSFNFLYFIIQKFKFSDIIDQ